METRARKRSKGGRRAFLRGGFTRRPYPAPPGPDTLESVATESILQALEKESERSLRDLGELEERVVGAVVPQRIGETLVPWPSQALGRIRLVRRERGVLFVTEGLSHPFDASMHGPGKAPLGFELGIELEQAALALSSDELARSWVVPALLWCAACYVLDEFRLLDLIERFGMVTQLLPPDPVLRHLVLEDGSVGALAGMPLSPTTTFGRDAQTLLAAVDGCESRLVVLTSITPGECDWVRGVADGSRAMELAKWLWSHGEGHRTIPSRASPHTRHG